MIFSNTPIDPKIVSAKISESGLPDFDSASIREIVKLVNIIEKESGQKYMRMEMGVPGLPAPEIGINAEIEALKRGVASKYPMIEGVADLKRELKRFVKLFIDIEVDERGCLPSVGSMQGSFATFLVANRTDKSKEGTLFLDPGFPVHKQICKVIGHEWESIDLYDYRGEKLRNKLEQILSKGKTSSILYSNPNNPSWISLNETELRIIGEMADKYDVIVIEDLAYFGMDFRKDYTVPGEPPFQPTVAKYTENYVLLISSSKLFNYAGQRVGTIVISDYLYNRRYPDLKRYYKTDEFGYSMIYGSIYALSSGTTHSAQYGLAAMLKAVNNGEMKLTENVLEYGQRAKIMKRLFKENGFSMVYEYDEDEELADGFYFTFSYPGFTGNELLNHLLYYGISAITLSLTGSTRTEGLRACVSQIGLHQMPILEERLKKFNEDHQKKIANL
jgi:aspartate/methionine/tyrosine aminotransferase